MTQLHCTSRQADFHGWRACYLENRFIRLVAVPDIGGRVMAYDLGPYAFLYVDPRLVGKLFTAEENQGDGSLAAWKNYGGDKTWPAPQGWDRPDQWHGPPDPVLDTGRYTLNELGSDNGSATVRMTSPPDPRTGLQIVRQFTIERDSSRVRVQLTFTNISDRPVRWSIWDVVQLRAERIEADGRLSYEPSCVVTTPVNPASRFPRKFHVMFGAEDNPQWQVDAQHQLFSAPYQWQIGKVGLDSTAGWIAFSNPAAGYAFCERFTYEPGAEYPDAGSTVEIWTVGAGEVGNLNFAGSDIYHVETEILSPLRTLMPGEKTSFSLEWAAARAHGRVIDVAPGGLTTERLALQPAGAFWQVRGIFGVFDVGRVVLEWLDGNGETLRADECAHADPLAVIALDRLITPPAHARQVRAVVVAMDGTQRDLHAPVALPGTI
jgi:hypothetical protein